MGSGKRQAIATVLCLSTVSYANHLESRIKWMFLSSEWRKYWVCQEYPQNLWIIMWKNIRKPLFDGVSRFGGQFELIFEFFIFFNKIKLLCLFFKVFIEILLKST